MANISDDAQGVLEGATAAQKDFVMSQDFGSRLTSGEATRFLAQSSNVFATENIQAEGQPRPDDLLGIRSQIQGDLGIPGLNEQFQEQFAGINEFDTATELQQNQIENMTVGLNVIRGAQGEANRQRSQERSGLARTLAVTQSQLQAAQQEAQFQFGIREGDVRARQQLILQNPGAGITFGDSIEQSARKIKKYEDKQIEEARKQAKKDTFDQLYMSEFGEDRGKLSRKEARKKLEKRMGKKEARAEEERLLDMAIKRKSLNSKKADSDLSASSWKTENQLRTQVQKMKAQGTSWGDAEAAASAAGGWSKLSGGKLDRVLWEVYRGEIPEWMPEEDGGRSAT